MNQDEFTEEELLAMDRAFNDMKRNGDPYQQARLLQEQERYEGRRA